ncbi:MAG: N-acetylmuramoyl-L-alanine amidase [Clostridia bacterium]|nr:N-acetylmuramoyl-L-alanine amidase [Clostridia bacterium]
MKKTRTSILNYLIFTVLFAGVALLTGKAALETDFGTDELAAPTIAEAPVIQLVIDPGHGGEDGGANVGDVLEKDLNLSVSENLADICTVFGYSFKMTRTDDRLLYDHFGDLADYTGKKKTYDLKNRLRIAEESAAELFVGIHMNKFPQSRYRGLQVYYSPNVSDSEIAARLVQSYAKKYVAPDNNREIKASGDSIYILKSIEIPAILVECGFISNPEECTALQTPEYRARLGAVIFSSCAEYLVTAEK